MFIFDQEVNSRELNGIQFAHVKKKELYFVMSSLKRNLSPSLALELLESIVSVSVTSIFIIMTTLFIYTEDPRFLRRY